MHRGWGPAVAQPLADRFLKCAVRGDRGVVIGHIETHHLLAGRLRDLREERERERVLATTLWQRSRSESDDG